MRHTVRFAALAFGLIVWLCASSNAHAQQQIRIQDDQGTPVKNAEVVIDCSGNRREGVADAGGTFSFGQINGPTQCAFAISSARTETHAGVLDIPASGRVSQVIVVTRKRVWIVQVTVSDEETKSPISGVEIKFDCGSDTWFRTTNGAGMAELDKIIAARQCTITTVHNRYEPLTTVIAIPTGMFEPIRHQVAVKPKINIKNVTITVVDSETQRPIAGARILLSGRFFSGGSVVTADSGVADIVIDRPGSFEVEVRHDSYMPVRFPMSIEAGASGDALKSGVSLVRKPANDEIKLVVSVKGRRLDGMIVDLNGAALTIDGVSGSYTGSDGKATIAVPGLVGDTIRITARAEGYESAAKDLYVPRFLSSAVAPDATLILNEKKKESAGVNLIIEVTDRKDGRPVAGATVALAGKAGTSNAITDARGYVQFSISGDAIKNEQYLKYTVKKEGYVEKWSDVGADLLKPSDEPRYYSIQIEKPVDTGDSIFWGTWRGVGNAAGITMTINRDYTMTFSDTRPGYQRSGNGGWARDTSRVNFIATAIGYGFWYHNDGRMTDPWGNFYTK